MIYANNRESITFPFSPNRGTPVDNQKETLTKKFFMSETQVTNALMAEVLNWAYDHGKFSTTVGDPNGLDNTTVKYGGQELLDLNYGAQYMKISYNTLTHKFSVAEDYEKHPVVCVTWYGAIMFCNWLTEMRDGVGNTDNCVYTVPDTGWIHTGTGRDDSKTGYRLPSSEEWEYAARYIGTTPPTEGNLATEYIARGKNNGHADLTAGYYWTPADYASGAIKDYTNETETRAVAWYKGDPDMGGDKLMPVKRKTANQLGLYDMSGNVWEWCFTVDGSYRVYRGGSWNDSAYSVQAGYWSDYYPDYAVYGIGFRFVRTQ
jgi:formylglycine-generating enzyme required for sulfatase activity